MKCKYLLKIVKPTLLSDNILQTVNILSGISQREGETEADEGGRKGERRAPKSILLTFQNSFLWTTLILFAVIPDDHLWIEAEGLPEYKAKLYNLNEEQ